MASSPILRYRILIWLLASVLVFPVLVLLWLSLVQKWAYPQLWDSFFTIQNWQQAITGGRGIGESLLFSLLFSAIIAVGSTFLGVFCSQIIQYHPKRSTLLSLAYYPYFIAPVVLGSMLQYYFLRWGLVGSWLGVAVAQLLFVFPYAVIFFSGFWSLRVKDLQSQALTLGATPTQAFRRIVLPMAKPWIVVCLFQCFLISWFEYGITQLIGVGQVPTLTIRVIQLVKEANPYLAAVASLLMALPPLLLLAINRQVLARGWAPGLN